MIFAVHLGKSLGISLMKISTCHHCAFMLQVGNRLAINIVQASITYMHGSIIDISGSTGLEENPYTKMQFNNKARLPVLCMV